MAHTTTDTVSLLDDTTSSATSSNTSSATSSPAPAPIISTSTFPKVLVLESIEYLDILRKILSEISPTQLPNLQFVSQRWCIAVRALSECSLKLHNTYLHFNNFHWSGGPVTVEFWLRVYKPHENVLFCGAQEYSTDSGERFQAHVPWSDEKICWDYGGIKGRYNDSGRLQAPFRAHWYGKWNHFAFVSTGAVFESEYSAIYVNGERIAKHAKSDSSPQVSSLTIGRRPLWEKNNHEYFNGNLRDFRIWNKVRTEKQIKNRMKYLPRSARDRLTFWLPLSSPLEIERKRDLCTKQFAQKVQRLEWDGFSFKDNVETNLQIARPKKYLQFNRGSISFKNFSNWEHSQSRPITVEFFINVVHPHAHVLFTFNVEDEISRFQAHVPWSNSKITFDYGGFRNATVKGRTLADFSHFDTWTHVALVSEGRHKKTVLYVNALAVGGNDNSDVPKDRHFEGPLYLGCDGRNSAFFSGGLWRFKVWERALTADEVKNAALGRDVGKESLRVSLALEEDVVNERTNEKGIVWGSVEWKKM